LSVFGQARPRPGTEPPWIDVCGRELVDLDHLPGRWPGSAHVTKLGRTGWPIHIDQAAVSVFDARSPGARIRQPGGFEIHLRADRGGRPGIAGKLLNSRPNRRPSSPCNSAHHLAHLREQAGRNFDRGRDSEKARRAGRSGCGRISAGR
jgi:hypothetical protein